MCDSKLHNKDHLELHMMMHTEHSLTEDSTSVTNSKIKCIEHCPHSTTNHRRLINNPIPHTIIAIVTYLTIQSIYIYFIYTKCEHQSRDRRRCSEHKLIHTDEKPDKCDKCGDRRRCYEHKLIHTDEKSVKCSYVYLTKNVRITIVCFLFFNVYMFINYLSEPQLKDYKIPQIAPNINTNVYTYSITTLQRIT